MRDQALRTNTTVDRGQEIREGTENNPVWQGANYLLSLDTFLPKDGNLDDYGRVKEVDALSYTELEKYGFGKLVQPIMDAGGYAAVSKAMGVAVSAPRAPPVPSDDDEREGPQRGVSLGGSIEEKMAEIGKLNATNQNSTRSEGSAKAARRRRPRRPNRRDELVAGRRRRQEARPPRRNRSRSARAPRGGAAVAGLRAARPRCAGVTTGECTLGAPGHGGVFPGAGRTVGRLLHIRVPVGAGGSLAANVAAAGVVVFRGSERPAALLKALVERGRAVLLEEGLG